jgi:hypothetical protein
MVKVTIAKGPATLSFQYGTQGYTVEFDSKGEAEVEDRVADILRRRYRQRVSVPAVPVAIKTEVSTNALGTKLSAEVGDRERRDVPDGSGPGT